MLVSTLSRWAAGTTLLAALACPSATMAEEGTVEAFSSWEARGHVLPTGPQEMTFVGVLSGVLYVTGSDDSMDVGLISCPGSILINTEDGSQAGSGKCVITTPDAERIYAKFTCTGIYMSGCDGDFTLTGGTGDKAGISGGGPIRFRSAFSDLVRTTAGNIVEQSAIGIAIWPELTYKLP